MRTARTSRLCLLVLVFPVSLFAAQEYELGKTLTSIGVPRLAIYMFEKQLEQADPPIEVYAGLGAVWKDMGDGGGQGLKPVDCYEKAEKYFEDFKSRAPETHPVWPDVTKALAEMKLHIARAKLKQAKREQDEEKAVQLRAEAREIFKRVVDDLRKSAKAAEEDYRKLKKLLHDIDEKTAKRQHLDKKVLKGYGRYYLGMQAYFKAALEMVEGFEEDSPERSKFLEGLIEDITSLHNEVEAEDYLIDAIWVEFAWGYALVKAEDYESAVAKFDLALTMDPIDVPIQFRPYVKDVQMTVHYYRAKALFEQRKYDEADKAVTRMFSDYPESKKQQWGLASLEIQCRCRWELGKHEEAIKLALDGLRTAEEMGSVWRNNFKNLMNEFYVWVIQNNPELLKYFQDAATNYAIAQGFYMKKEYEKAIEGYRSVVRATRREGVPWSERLRFEPKAWVEMGLSYFKMGLARNQSERFYEAALAFAECVQSFDKPMLPKELLESKSDQMQKLLKEVDATVERAYKNAIGVSRRRYSETRNIFDRGVVDWAEGIVDIGGDESEKAFKRGQRSAEKAEQTLDAVQSRDYLAKAVTEFKKVTRASDWYEYAQWKAGYSLYRTIYQHHREWIRLRRTGRIPDKVLKDMQRLREQMDRHFDTYFAHVKQQQTFDQKRIDTRKSRTSQTPVIRVMAYYYCGRNDLVVQKGAETIAKLDAADPNYGPFLWYYFKALLADATAAARKADLDTLQKRLLEADKVRGMFKDHPKARRYYVLATTRLSTVCKEIAAILKSEAKKRNKPLLAQAAETYQKKAIDYLFDIAKPTDPPEQIAALAFQFLKIGANKEAAVLFGWVLNGDQQAGTQGLDPDGDNQVSPIPDELFKELRSEAEGPAGRRIKLYDVKAQKKAYALLEKVAPLINDPEQVNYGQARGVVESIIAAVKARDEREGDVTRLDALDKILEEVRNRRIILACRNGIVKSNIALAHEFKEKGEEEASLERFAQAGDGIEALRKFWPMDKDLMMSQADVLFALSEWVPAAQVYRRVFNLGFCPMDSEEWLYIQKQALVAQYNAGEQDPKHLKSCFGDVKSVKNTVDQKRWLAYWPEFPKFVETLEKRLPKELVEYTPDMTKYDTAERVPLSKADSDYEAILSGVRTRAHLEGWDEERLKKELKDKTITHFRNLIAADFNAIVAGLAVGSITEKQRDLRTRWNLIEYLSKPIPHDDDLRKQAAELLDDPDVTEETLRNGIPIKFLVDAHKDWKYIEIAKELKILSDDNKILVEEPGQEVARLKEEYYRLAAEAEKEEE